MSESVFQNAEKLQHLATAAPEKIVEYIALINQARATTEEQVETLERIVETLYSIIGEGRTQIEAMQYIVDRSLSDPKWDATDSLKRIQIRLNESAYTLNEALHIQQASRKT